MEQLVELLRKQLEASQKRADEWAAAEAKLKATRVAEEAKREEKWAAAEAEWHAADFKRAEDRKAEDAALRAEYAATTQTLVARIKALPAQQLDEGTATPLNIGLAQEHIMQSLSLCIAAFKFDPDNDVVEAIEHQTKKPQLKPGRGDASDSLPMEVYRSKPPGACWNCGEEGHFKAYCTFKNNKCCECGVVGHKDGRCVNKREFRPLVGQIVIQGIITMQNVERNYADVVIHGVEVKLLAVSGSDLTMITHEDWKKMGQPTLTRCRDASAVNGSSIRLYGYFDTKFCCTLASRNGSGMCYISDDIRVMGRGWLNQVIPEYLQALKIICATAKRRHESEDNATSTIAERQGEQHVKTSKSRNAKHRRKGAAAKILQKEPRQGLLGTAMQSQPPLRRSARIRQKLRKLDLDPHKASYHS
uniref:CCHC-type domain-containing protein n=1 Tax=Plectus sambesii TaxID=2011161 RepID=A0A914XGH3_9BILA